MEEDLKNEDNASEQAEYVNEISSQTKTETRTEEEKVSVPQTKEEAEVVLNSKGFDFKTLTEEYKNNNGDLKPETKEALAKVGITEEVFQNYIAGQRALAEKELDTLSECIGGREELDTVIQWAGKNLKKKEIQSINAIKDTSILKIILKDLKGRMESKEGKTPEYTTGTGVKTTEKVFESKAQMIEAIKDPRYTKDEAYRAEVTKKIAASRAAGKNIGV